MAQGLTPDQVEASALSSFEIAEDCRVKGKAGRECNVLCRGLTGLLSSALRKYDSPAPAINYLRQHRLVDHLIRFDELNSMGFTDFLRDPRSVKRAVVNQITFVHIAWLLEAWDLADRQLAICVNEDVAKHFPLTKFWKEYHRAIECLQKHEPYDPSPPKVGSYERYWVPYLHLVRDLTCGNDLDVTNAELSEMFSKRNSDRRLIDYYSLDGDGNIPVRWDFRHVSIMMYWSHKS